MGWIGIWLLAFGSALIVVELALIGPRLLRLQRKAAVLRSLLENEDAARSLEVERLQQALMEISLRLRPYRRIRRVALHPLTVALVASYRRRRARR